MRLGIVRGFWVTVRGVAEHSLGTAGAHPLIRVLACVLSVCQGDARLEHITSLWNCKNPTHVTTGGDGTAGAVCVFISSWQAMTDNILQEKSITYLNVRNTSIMHNIIAVCLACVQAGMNRGNSRNVSAVSKVFVDLSGNILEGMCKREMSFTTYHFEWRCRVGSTKWQKIYFLSQATLLLKSLGLLLLDFIT